MADAATDPGTSPSPPSSPAPKPYLVQRVSWTGPPGRFETDFEEQRLPIVGFHLWGQCPNCSDMTMGICSASDLNPAMFHSPGIPSPTHETVSTVDSQLGRTRKIVAVMTCRCDEPHQQPPPPPNVDGVAQAEASDSSAPPAVTYGCGASWLVEVSYSRNKRLSKRQIQSVVPVRKEVAFKYWQAAETIAATSPDTLKNIHDVASSWQTALTAILGLLTASTLIGGRDALEKIAPSTQHKIGEAAAVSVATALVALVLFAYAGGGAPRIKPFSRPKQLINADLRPLRAAWWSTVTFYSAFVAAFVSVIATCYAVGNVWYGKAAPSDKNVEITVPGSNGDALTLCGVVTVSSGNFVIKPGADGATSSTYPITKVTKIGTC